MAKKTSTRGKGKPDAARLLQDAAFAYAEEGRWSDVSLAEIAERAGLPVAEAYQVYPSRRAILRAFLRQVDDTVLAGTEAELAAEPARDRLFDVTMRRFDALAPRKAALAVIVHDLMRDPLVGFCALPGLACSQARMLEAAGLSSEGLKGRLRVKVLSALYLDVLRVWFRDETEDSAKTMAALDKRLGQLDCLVKRVCRPRGAAQEAA